jgi:hypothetical protein
MHNLNLATVVTKSHLKEFLFLKFTCERFHNCSWSVICDDYSYNYLKNLYQNVLLYKSDITNGSVFGDSTEQDNFFKTICEKFEVCRKGLKNKEYVLFVDSDIVFTEKVCSLFTEFINSDNDIIVSPHYQLNPGLDSVWGRFNVGFIMIKNPKVIDDWESITKTKKYLFEQMPLDVLLQSNKYKYDTFPINYNMGWWRFNNQKTQHRLECLDIQRQKISLNGIPINSFHVHMFLNKENPQGQFLLSILKEVFNKVPSYYLISEEYERLSKLSI